MANRSTKTDSKHISETSTNSTFSLRLPPKDYRTLASVAGLRKVSIAELAREFILDGLRRALDPDEIERLMEEEKQRLLAAAAEMREAAQKP
ncbi:hypothetical protein ACIBCD_42580 [Nocardia brasiliensis]|uniref:hypothetical protein n=1 Tax=Nocardia brasiliensis TaxID=37326 RepID=UPI00378F3348